MDYRYLLGIEVGGIQRFITESSRLREVRGASALLDKLNRQCVPARLAREFGSDVGIVRSSGSVTIAGVRAGAPEGTAGRVLGEVRELYEKALPGAVLYDAVVECRDGEAVAALLSRLSYETAVRQGASPGGEADLLDPLVRYCDSCGMRPAEHARRIGDDADLICRTCKAKSDYGVAVRRAGWLARFEAAVAGRPDWAGVDLEAVLPDDFTAIGETAPTRDIALILADGNRLGETLRALTSLSQYQAFSEGVAQAVEDAVFEALAEHGPRRGVLPWEILFLGGDDLLLVTAADLALSVAQRVLRGVERRTADLFVREGLSDVRPYLSLAAGVAIADSHYPFQALHTLAGELEGEAKRRAYVMRGQEASVIDFHRVTSSGRTSLKRVRRDELRPQRPGMDGTSSLTMRPFVLDELEHLQQVARRWRGGAGAAGVPNHKLHYLRESLFESPAEAMFAWAHVVGRARPEERALWRLLDGLTELGIAEGGTYEMPWIIAPGDGTLAGQARRRTYLLDVVELHALLARRKDGESI